MSEPRFKLGQRVYNRANPYHGKVIAINKWNAEWSYTLALDLPNPSNCPQANIFEDGLRATLEEAIAWQEEMKRTIEWGCGRCYGSNDAGATECKTCGQSKASMFPDTE